MILAMLRNAAHALISVIVILFINLCKKHKYVFYNINPPVVCNAFLDKTFHF